jgi:hypothetical protein
VTRILHSEERFDNRGRALEVGTETGEPECGSMNCREATIGIRAFDGSLCVRFGIHKISLTYSLAACSVLSVVSFLSKWKGRKEIERIRRMKLRASGEEESEASVC